jgi:hypothetical protein
MRRLRASLVALVLAGPVAAHDVPFRTSCSFEPLAVEFPSLGMTGTGAAPTKADALRLTDATTPQSVQFNAATVPARPLAGLGTSATLQLPAAFAARVLASGDFTAPDVPLLLDVDGTGALVPVTLTTGLAAADGVVAEGTPMSGSGVFALVGVAPVDGLAAPLGGATAVFRLSCTTAPVPDVDKFPLVELRKLGGRITTKKLRLHGLLDAGSLPADFAAPALLRVSTGGTTIATVVLPGGLAARGRRTWIGESTDGTQRVTVRLRRKRPTPLYAVSLRVDGAVPALPAGRPSVTLTSQVGGIVVRATKAFRGGR